MINNFKEYELELNNLYLQLAVVGLYRLNNRDVESVHDWDAIQSFYHDYKDILEGVKSLFEDPAFKSFCSGAKDE